MGQAGIIIRIAVAVLLATPAVAAVGDVLIVTGDGVNVRVGPSGDSAIRLRVSRDRQVIELQREGSWVRVEISGTTGQEGWIHSSLLAEPSEAAASGGVPALGSIGALEESSAPSIEEAAAGLLVEPAAGSDRGLGELARFRETVTYLNGRAATLVGGDLFAEVKPGPGGAMQVVATETWSDLAPGSRQSYANTLLGRWAATKESAGPAIVQIVDPSGEVVMEKSEP
ncbi:MAG: SH3 domain-containing protein [Pseudomonadota bacterium]